MKTLAISEIAKINEVLEMSEKEIMAIKKRFTSIHRVDEKTAIIKDWLDDSIQLVKIK